MDFHGTLYDSELHEITSNDDSQLIGRSTDFHPRATLEPGVYYVAVSSFNTTLGGYLLWAETVGALGTINLGESKAGTLTSDSDTAQFRADLDGKSNVILFVKGITANNPRLGGLGDVNEYAFYLDDEFYIVDNFSGSPTVTVSADSPGTYTIQAFDHTRYTNFINDCTAWRPRRIFLPTTS